MVDPISLIAISGVAAAGLLAGKITKKEDKISPEPESTKITEMGEIHFISILDEINPDLIVSKVSKGHFIFINIKNLLLKPQKLNRFTNELGLAARLNSLSLKQVSSEILLLTDRSQTIHVHTLTSKMKNFSNIDCGLENNAG